MTQTTMEINNVDRPWVRKVVFGLFAHGAGPISDKRKGNRSPRWSASRRILTARRVSFTAVLTISLVCPTGLRIFDFQSKEDALFFRSTGPGRPQWLPKEKETSCQHEQGDCRYGYRILPRFSLEVGTHLSKNQGLSLYLYLDHMSHKGIGNTQFEGLDRVGIRYHLFSITILEKQNDISLYRLELKASRENALIG